MESVPYKAAVYVMLINKPRDSFTLKRRDEQNRKMQSGGEVSENEGLLVGPFNIKNKLYFY